VVAFSEPVSTVGSPSFSLSMQPGLVFDVWKKVGDTLMRQDSMLAGITSFYNISADSTQAAFYMTNGKDLSTNYLLSLKSSPPGITDKAVSKNPPAGNNQKVRVQVMVESSTHMPNIVLGLRNPFIVRFDSFGKQVFVQTANNAKNASVKIALFSLNGKMLFSSQAMTNTWTSLPPATNSIRIIKIEAGGRTICTKVGLF
jgi:hypothetical protein